MMIRCRLSSVKCGTPSSFPLGMLSISSTILWKRQKKGNGVLAPPSAAMIADNTQFWLTQIHEMLTNFRREAGKSRNVIPELSRLGRETVHPHERRPRLLSERR